jgi:GTP-binding protein Era
MEQEAADTKHRSIFVTLAGRPNVGKSTLLNRIIGSKVAITSPRPQTTRNRIVGVYTRPGLQIVFMDTPGVMREKSKLNSYMVKIATATGAESDLLVFMTDATKPALEEDLFALSRFTKLPVKKFLVVNKVDAVKKPTLVPIIAEWNEKLGPFDEVIPLSAKTGENVDAFIDLIESNATEGPQFYPGDMLTDAPEQFMIAEIIRERMFYLLQEEIPYSIAVTVDQVQDKPEKEMMVIYATINVERESQKGIVIGSKGTKLKQIGSSAREELERRFGVKIFLDLRVVVRARWTSDPKSLDRFGYSDRNE